MRQTKIVVMLLVIALLGFATYKFTAARDDSTNNKATNASTRTTSPPPSTHTTAFDMSQYSLTDPTSIWVIVNKKHGLNPKTYIPADLVVPSVSLRVPGNSSMQVRKVTAADLEKLVRGAKNDGINLQLSSGYRSYSFQVSLYNSYVQSDGQAAADRASARPGYSEHQTGLAADLDDLNHQCHLEACFGDTPEGKWLAAHAYEYGFVIRYPKGKESITGYEYEPWHIRYLGIPAATEMHRTGIQTLEEFFDVTGGQNY
jgi:D-alanyl-D-alanine carboxypeptidase